MSDILKIADTSVSIVEMEEFLEDACNLRKGLYPLAHSVLIMGVSPNEALSSLKVADDERSALWVALHQFITLFSISNASIHQRHFSL